MSGPLVVADRLLGDLEALRQFGRRGSGVVRPALSAIDLESRHWLVDRLGQAGLAANLDGVGNVIGRSPNSGPALLVGSHSDTQPTGGWLDGALGVIYGLEVARALSEHPSTASLAVDTVSWVDEESRFVSCLGSRAFCGLVDQREVQAAVDSDGLSLLDALDQADLDGLAAAARPEPDRYFGYLEGHIEQGPDLEHRDLRIGVVSAIVGVRSFTISFRGQQNHAGTTPMPLRRDAGMALLHLGVALDQRLSALAGPRTVWTMGRLSVEPGASSIIPGRAELHLQMRDPSRERLESMVGAVQETVTEATGQSSVEIVATPAPAAIDPVDMDEGFRRHLATAAEHRAPGRWQHMPSAAVHDAMFLAEVMPAGMLFIPSIGGVSHDFAEDSTADDIVLGAQVLVDAAAAILAEAPAAIEH